MSCGRCPRFSRSFRFLNRQESPLGAMLNNVVFRKGKQWGLRYLKQFLAAGGSPENPVFINSFPKSGTHLLYQLFEARDSQFYP